MSAPVSNLKPKRVRRFRLTAPVPPETDLHGAVADALAILVLPPAEWSTFPAGHCELSERAAAKLARLGLKRNWADIIVVHKGVFGIELKRPGGRLSRTRAVRTRCGRLRMVEGQHVLSYGAKTVVCDTYPAINCRAMFNKTHR